MKIHLKFRHGRRHLRLLELRRTSSINRICPVGRIVSLVLHKVSLPLIVRRSGGLVDLVRVSVVGRESTGGLIAFVIKLGRLLLLMCHGLYHVTTIVAEATISGLRTRVRVVLMRDGGALVLACFLMRGGEAALLWSMLVMHVTGHEGLHVGCEVFKLLSTHINDGLSLNKFIYFIVLIVSSII